jgi:hypothetical protein
MHLRDGSGRHRRAERHEQGGKRLGQRDFDGVLGLGLGERGHLVLQRLEVACQCHADHVRPRRQELAELDVGGAEPGERRCDAIRRYAARRPLDQPR